MAIDTAPAFLLIDAHAHLYECFDPATYFDATVENFRRARRELAIDAEESHPPAFLLLAEPAGVRAFDMLLARGEVADGRWRFEACPDGLSLVARRDGRDELIFVRGRQAKTRERLEVLSLCCDDEPVDGLPTAVALEHAVAMGGLAVLPLGAGKWLGARGRIVDGLLRGPLAGTFFLGDNAGRLAWGPPPRQFGEANRAGTWVLPGSGVLPFRSQGKRVGRYGLAIRARLDRNSPAASIIEYLRSATEQPRTFGRPDGPLTYLRLQSAMQVYNVMRARRGRG
jgi:hypothetical protein